MITLAHHPTIAAAHLAHFSQPAARTASAPGRVNLLGEHTDYNGGYVLPIVLRDLGVEIAASTGTPGLIEIRSETLDDTAKRAISEGPADHWSDYVLGAAAAVAEADIAAQGLRLTISTTVPLGAGLSSSAALEVATLRAVLGLFNIQMSPVEIAMTARRVENDFVGVPCGIMDQFSSGVGIPGEALFLDTRTLDYASAPSLPGHVFVVVDSGVRHQLSDGGYATRVEECHAACIALGVAFLSDLTQEDLPRIDALPAPLNRRARHIVTDNALTKLGLEALREGNALTFGLLMTASHATEKNNYDITVPQTDALAAAAVSHGALGARQTGGGWGGAVVALLAEDRLPAWSKTIEDAFPAAKILAVT